MHYCDAPHEVCLRKHEKFYLTGLNSYLDRINVSNARLAGMQADCGDMTDVEWSAGISLFYVGYIISQVPASVIIAKGKPRVIMPLIMLCRFLVGLTEGPFLPAVSLMTSWYTKEESPLRMAIWHAGNIISNVFSGLIAAGVLTDMDNVRGLHSWQ